MSVYARFCTRVKAFVQNINLWVKGDTNKNQKVYIIKESSVFFFIIWKEQKQLYVYNDGNVFENSTGVQDTK